jgi:eukaryotic-like serine/threonine-protein kinase
MCPSVKSRRFCRFGDFEVDLDHGLLTRKGVRVKLQDQPFRILAMLLDRPGEIVSREELQKELWPDGTFVDFEGSLNAALKRLRAALGEHRDQPVFLETVPKRGYRFIASVTWGAPSTDLDGLTSIPLAPTSPKAHPRAWLRTVVILSAVLGIGLIALFLARHRFFAPKADSARTTLTPAKPVVARRAVAVLGFHNVTGKEQDAWMGTALTEMMSTELAGGGKLRLVSGEDVAHLRFISPWLQTDSLNLDSTSRIGAALNSDYLVLGSYTTIGSRPHQHLRLDVRLQDAQRGEILTEVAEVGDSDDLFHLVSGVGAKLRERLGVPPIAETDEASVIASLPANAEAIRFYALGLNKLRAYDIVSARDFFEEATKADSKFALAYSMLSRADIFLGHDDQAKTEAKKGLELASGLSRTQKLEIEASYYQSIADRARAAEIYRVLFGIFPDSLDYGLYLAKLQLESYQPDAALETVRQLRQLPPPASDDPSIDLREGFIVQRNDVVAADRLYHIAAAKAQALGKKLIYARAQASICTLNLQRLQAPPECQEAYDAFIAAGDRDDAGSCQQLMAEAQRWTGHNQQAIPLYQAALRTLREAGDREKVGVAENNLALIFESQGQWAQAEAAFRDALHNFQLVNDKANTGTAFANIADILVFRGRLREAADLYRQGWETVEASHRGRPEYAHIQHAALLLTQGRLNEAQQEIEAQVGSLRSFGGDPWLLANAVSVLGDIDKAQAHLDIARKHYQEAIDLVKKANSPVAVQQVSMAELSIVEGHADEAEILLRGAIAELEKEHSAGDEINGYTSLSRALLAEGKTEEATQSIAHALQLADLRPFPALSLPLQLLHARVTAASAKPGSQAGARLNTASEEMRRVIGESQKLGLYTINCEARLALARLRSDTNGAALRDQLQALAAEARSHGLELLARDAEKTASGRK